MGNAARDLDDDIYPMFVSTHGFREWAEDPQRVRGELAAYYAGLPGGGGDLSPKQVEDERWRRTDAAALFALARELEREGRVVLFQRRRGDGGLDYVVRVR